MRNVKVSVRMLLATAALACACGCGGRTFARGTGTGAEVKPEPVPPELAKLIEECRAGKYDTACPALYEYSSAHADSPHRALAQYWLGYGEFRRQHYNAAAEAFAVAACTDDIPLKGKALLGRGDALFQLGRFREAAGCYAWVDRNCQNVKSIAPDEVLFKLGMCYKVRNMTEQADNYFNTILQLYAHGDYAMEARRMHSVYGKDPARPRFFELEAGVYTSKQQAEARAREIRSLKVDDVYVLPIDTGLGETRYAVRFGRFDTYNQARLKAQQLKQDYLLSASVTPFDASQEIFQLFGN
ncbi:MAG: SPOR domain-containing protein [Planctomycetota bacterium]|nr:SPOR domain-containing protein [Planctomycetota bacterium]